MYRLTPVFPMMDEGWPFRMNAVITRSLANITRCSEVRRDKAFFDLSFGAKHRDIFAADCDVFAIPIKFNTYWDIILHPDQKYEKVMDRQQMAFMLGFYCNTWNDETGEIEYNEDGTPMYHYDNYRLDLYVQKFKRYAWHTLNIFLSPMAKKHMKELGWSNLLYKRF